MDVRQHRLCPGMRDGGRDVHSLECAIRIAQEPQVPSREGAVVLLRPLPPQDRTGLAAFGRRAALPDPLPAALWIPATPTPGRSPERRARSHPSTSSRTLNRSSHPQICSVLPCFSACATSSAAISHALRQIGTGQVNEQGCIDSPPRPLPLDPGPSAKHHCARIRLLGFARCEALAIPQRPAGCIPKVHLQLRPPVVIGQLLQQFEPALELRDRFGS